MLGMSPHGRISRRGASNLKLVGSILIGLFCDPKVGVLKILFDVRFCMGAGRCREKSDLLLLTLNPLIAAPVGLLAETIRHHAQLCQRRSVLPPLLGDGEQYSLLFLLDCPLRHVGSYWC